MTHLYSQPNSNSNSNKKYNNNNKINKKQTYLLIGWANHNKINNNLQLKIILLLSQLFNNNNLSFNLLLFNNNSQAIINLIGIGHNSNNSNNKSQFNNNLLTNFLNKISLFKITYNKILKVTIILPLLIIIANNSNHTTCTKINISIMFNNNSIRRKQFNKINKMLNKMMDLKNSKQQRRREAR